MILDLRKRKAIPNLNAPNNEWKKYWNSCSIGEGYTGYEGKQ